MRIFRRCKHCGTRQFSSSVNCPTCGEEICWSCGGAPHFSYPVCGCPRSDEYQAAWDQKFWNERAARAVQVSLKV